MRMPIRWGDMDAMGHVNNTVYFRYIETARIAWLEQVGGMVNPEGQGPVIVNASMNFLKQLTYPGEIEVRTFVAPPGRASVEVSHEIRLVGADLPILKSTHTTLAVPAACSAPGAPSAPTRRISFGT
jgi:acyl-CoA thioester hydrolase